MSKTTISITISCEENICLQLEARIESFLQAIEADFGPNVECNLDEEHFDACPGCGCRPGDGLTPGCEHEDGCGFHRDLEGYEE